MSSAAFGIGACGCGSAGAGYGSPAQVNSATAPLFRKSDGTYGDCQEIDTRPGHVGDYKLDADGNPLGWDSVKQMVYLALKTVLGSSAVPTMGLELEMTIIRDDTARKNRLSVEAALSRLITQGLIALIDVVTTRLANSAIQIEVKWEDISQGEINSTFV